MVEFVDALYLFIDYFRLTYIQVSWLSKQIYLSTLSFSMVLLLKVEAQTKEIYPNEFA